MSWRPASSPNKARVATSLLPKRFKRPTSACSWTPRPVFLSHRRRFGGRLHAGRDFALTVSQASHRLAAQTNPNRMPEGEQRLRRSRTRDERKPSGFPLIPKKGPGLHRTPARNGLTKRLKRSVLLLLRGLLGGLLGRLLRSLLLSHHEITSFS